MKQYALISLFDKKNLDILVNLLEDKGYSLLATGNTYRLIQEMGKDVTEVKELTGEPERFGGRVKTLHHRIHGALLLRPGKDEWEWPEDYRIACVACNFYPFVEKAESCQNLPELMEWVDIGGPTMVRAAAKNHQHVWVLTNPEQYDDFKKVTSENEEALRQKYSLEAFALVEELDRNIFQEFYRRKPLVENTGTLKYGENPHQTASFFPRVNQKLEVQGALSFNNFRDSEAALKVIAPFHGPTVSVIKHQTPCGVASSIDWNKKEEVFKAAWEGDDVSRFGSVLAFNFCPTPEITQTLLKKFIEVVVLPLGEESRAWANKFRAEKDRVRVLLVDPKLIGKAPAHKEVYEGALGRIEQDADFISQDKFSENTDELLKHFGQWVGACSKSNAIVMVGVKNEICFLAGAGQGQPNRVDALEKLAIPRAKSFCDREKFEFTELTCFSDGFLPFRDTLDVLKSHGITKLVQPGGSKQDETIIAAAQELGIAMEMTGERHFWH